jgi:hypothetical protein
LRQRGGETGRETYEQGVMTVSSHEIGVMRRMTLDSSGMAFVSLVHTEVNSGAGDHLELP